MKQYMDILQLLKQNAPNFYTYYISRKRISLNKRLEQLRKLYPTSDIKSEITKEANEIKNELKLYPPPSSTDQSGLHQQLQMSKEK